MNRSTNKPSSALDFLRTASESMPKGIGDRLYSSTMNSLMRTAIECGMFFHKDDIAGLRDLSFTSSVGVFTPFYEQLYSQSCLVGGTYPGVWEFVHATKPWKASQLLKTSRPGRIAPGIGCLLFEDDGKGLPKVDGLQLLWCTSITKEHIVLCRYRTTYTRSQVGKPATRLKLTRKEWDEANNKAVKAVEPAGLVAA